MIPSLTGMPPRKRSPNTHLRGWLCAQPCFPCTRQVTTTAHAVENYRYPPDDQIKLSKRVHRQGGQPIRTESHSKICHAQERIKYKKKITNDSIALLTPGILARKCVRGVPQHKNKNTVKNKNSALVKARQATEGFFVPSQTRKRNLR